MVNVDVVGVKNAIPELKPMFPDRDPMKVPVPPVGVVWLTFILNVPVRGLVVVGVPPDVTIAPKLDLIEFW